MTSVFLWPHSVWILWCLWPVFCKLLLPRYGRISCGHGVESPALLKPLSNLQAAARIVPVAARKLMVLWGASLACSGGGELVKLFIH